MRAAGIRRYSDPVELLDLPDPDELRSDEVLVEVRCCGIGNWDDIARTGGWDLGRQPPMALGVEAAGVIAGTGAAVHGRTSGSRPADGRPAGGPVRDGLAVGERVMTHSLPLRGQGAWAEWFVAAAADVAVIPDTVPFDVAAALPVPGLTADEALGDGLGAGPGATVLVHGASGVTGMLMVELAAGRGAEVIATAGTGAAARVTAAGAAHVLDRRAPDWPGQARRLTAGRGVDLAVNAAPAGAADAITAVRDGGRLVTITSDPPAADRGIDVREVYVAPDGTRLARLGELLAAGTIRVTVGAAYRLGDAERALGRVRRGSGGQAVVLQVTP
jgi:NADPH:quinone reductase-like Zn-dependent oxidoreductase